MRTAILRTGLGLWLVAAVASGCSSESKDESVEPSLSPSAAPAETQPVPATDLGNKAAPGLQELGTFRGHWDGKRLTFTPSDAKAAASGIKPQGFLQVPDAKMSFTTTESIVVNNCPENADPSVGYYTSGTHALTSNGHVCSPGHLCAMVRVENLASRDIGSVYVQITSITSGFAGDGNPLATVPSGYPLDNSKGLWFYDELPKLGSSGGAEVEWDFSLPTCEDFTFEVKVMGNLQRTSYTSQKGDMVSGEFLDACALGGTKVLEGSAAGASIKVPMTFPFTVYDEIYEDTVSPAIRISNSGALGFNAVTTGANETLGTSATRDYTIFPFWDNVQTPNGICYATSGTAPDRKFVITWNNADFADTTAQNEVENLTFSAVLSETTDLITFQYKKMWSTQTCAAWTGRQRGTSATIGIQGANFNGGGYAVGTEYVQMSGNINAPNGFDVCTANDFGTKVTLTPSVGNTF